MKEKKMVWLVSRHTQRNLEILAVAETKEIAMNWIRPFVRFEELLDGTTRAVSEIDPTAYYYITGREVITKEDVEPRTKRKTSKTSSNEET